jgi:hypothetical protein
MKSPFPGMDPYLEARWRDVHTKLIAFAGDALQEELPAALRARSEERGLLEEEDEEHTTYAAASNVAVAEPLRFHFHEAPETEREIHFIDSADGNRIVTVIEILSPWNKAGGRLNRDYRRKLRDYEDAGVNIVEIDLRRTPGRGNLKITEKDIPAARRTPYFICVSDAQTPGEWLGYPVSLRGPVPAIRIPLRKQDVPVALNLQPLIDRVYKAGGHDDIDYTKPLDPPLSPEDAAWTEELLRRLGQR